MTPQALPPHDEELSFSDVLDYVGRGDTPNLSLREIVDAFGERGFGALLLLLTLLALFPWPPGGKTLFAIPIILLSAEMALKLSAVWLPKMVLDRQISRAKYRRLLHKPLGPPRWARKLLLSKHRTGFRGWLRRTVAVTGHNPSALDLVRGAEKLTRPRLPALTGPLSDILIGLACIVMAIIMALPVPLGDMLPAIAIILLSLGVIQRDGMFVLAGAAFSIISVIYVVLVWHTIVHIFTGLNHLIHALF